MDLKANKLHMNRTTLIIGLSIYVLNIILGSMALELFSLTYLGYLLLFTIVTFLLWFLALRKNVKIQLTSVTGNVIKKTAIMIIIPFIAVLALLMGDTLIESENALYLLISALLVAIYEELLFRGIVQGTFIAIGNRPQKAILYTAVLFAVSHLLFKETFNLYILINSFIMGYVLGYVYFISKNILYTIAIHFFWDATVFLNQSIDNNEMAIVISLILFILSTLYFLWTLKDIKKL